MLATVCNVGKILELFDDAHPDWGVSDVAIALGLSRPTAHALLATLVHIGLLQHTPGTRYRLGWKLYALGNAVLRTTHYCHEARPAMEYLVNRFGEMVNLAVLDSEQAVYIAARKGTRGLHASLDRVIFPAHCTAAGKVLLAYRTSSTAVLRRKQQADLSALTAKTITCREVLKRELELVRQQGFARSVGEAFDEVCAMAAPVRDHTGAVVAAIGVVVPEFRFNHHQSAYLSGLLDAAGKASRNLGHFPDSVKPYLQRRTHNDEGNSSERGK